MTCVPHIEFYSGFAAFYVKTKNIKNNETGNLKINW
jgi:hypothetical protein